MKKLNPPNALVGSRYRNHNNQMLPYVWSLPYLFNKKVRDIGCGRGHGMLLQSFYAREITGIDVNDSFLAVAETHNYFCPVDLKQVDLNDPNALKELELAEVTTAFEIIDHLDDPRPFLKAVSRSSRVFMFSVPHMLEDRGHKTLYDFDRLESLINQFFPSVQWFFEKDNFITSYPYDPFRYLGMAFTR